MTDKKSLTGKIKNFGKTVGKTVLPVAFTAAGYLASQQNADAQHTSYQKEVYSYQNHNRGATIQKDNTGKGILELKIFQGVGSYFQNMLMEFDDFPRKMKNVDNEDIANTFTDTLGLISFYKSSAEIDVDAYSKNIVTVSSNKPNIWVKAKDASGRYITIVPLSNKINPKTKKPEVYAEILCDEQTLESLGITDKKANLIVEQNLENILAPVAENLSTINLNRKINKKLIKTGFYFPSQTDSTVYLIPIVEGYTKLRILPAVKDKKGNFLRTRQVAIVSPLGVYEQKRIGGRVSGKISIDNFNGTAEKPYAESNPTATQEKTPVAKTTEINKSLILGVEGNEKFIAGEAGFQYGPVALVANVGKGKDENILEINQQSTVSNKILYGKKDHANVWVKGAQLEGHLFDNQFVSPFAFVGLNNWSYNENSLDQIKAPNETILSESKNTVRGNDWSWKAGGGASIKLGKNSNSKLGLQAGYDSHAKGFVGARFSTKLGKK